MYIKIDDFLGNFAGNRHIYHPIHQVEAEEHDGEDDSAVLVNVAGPDAQYLVWRLGPADGWEERSSGTGFSGKSV